MQDEEAIPSAHLSFVRLYEESALELVCSQFDELLSREPPEAEILQFRVSRISHGECTSYTTSERLIEFLSRYRGVIN